MANPSSPRPTAPPSQPGTGQPGVVSDPDVPHAFGPDAPNAAERGDQTSSRMPEAPPPTPPSQPLEDDEIAPDET